MNRRQFSSGVGAAMALTLGAQSRSLTTGKGTDEEKQLVVMPLLWTREVFVVPPARPHCFLRHLNLEGFSSRNAQSIPNPLNPDHKWEWRRDGTFGCTGTITEGVTYSLTMEPGTEVIDMRVTVNNQGQRPLEDLHAAMCIDVRRNTLMYDPSLERTYVEVGGRLVAMRATDVAKSYQGVMPAYFLKGTPLERRWIPKGMADYGWDISKTEIDSPIVAIVSEDGTWTTGEWFWPCHHVQGNARQPYHGCIHSEPAFGNLSPGTSASVTGRLYLAAGSLEKVWARMSADWHQVGNRKATPAG